MAAAVRHDRIAGYLATAGALCVDPDPAGDAAGVTFIVEVLVMLIPVILSGGAGTRLWPVSRSAYPKPFMRMGDGQTLLYKTLDRALRVADEGRVLTVTGRDYYFLTRDE